MQRLALAAIGLFAVTAGAARADEITRLGPAASPIAVSVTVPASYDMVYVSGLTPSVIDPKAPPGTVAAYGDTKTQAISVFTKLSEALKAQGMSLADVVMMRVYLAGDPAKDGKMDFAGMMAAYQTFFGTPDQPNKPARVTSQVASLVGPGMLCEIEVQAARKPVKGAAHMAKHAAKAK
jgi:enamine deaminase RidA (YjgF/YER057c/UK114 family)